MKPENIFIEDGIFKVGDFGTAWMLKRSVTEQQKMPLFLAATNSGEVKHGGSNNYISPEMRECLLGQRDSDIDLFASDMYSLGVIVLELAKLELPKGIVTTDESVLEGIFSREISSLFRESNSPYEQWVRIFIASTLSFDPMRRIQVQELHFLLAHSKINPTQRRIGLVHFWEELEEYGDLTRVKENDQRSRLMLAMENRSSNLNVGTAVSEDCFAIAEFVKIELALDRMKFSIVSEISAAADRILNSKINSRAAKLYSLQSLACYYQHRFHEAKSLADRAIAILTARAESPMSMMHLHSILALTNLAVHQVPEAVEHAKFSVNSELKEHPTRNYCISHFVFGKILRFEGYLRRAEFHFRVALELNRVETARARRLVMQIYGELSLVYYYLNMRSECEYCLLKANEYRRINAKDCHIVTCQSMDVISLIYEKLGDNEMALKYSHKSLARKQQIEGIEHIAFVCNYRALIRNNLRINQIEKAKEYVRELRQLSKMGIVEVAENYHCFALYNLAVGKLEKAEKYEQVALSLLQEIEKERSEIGRQCLFTLSEIYSKMNEPSKSYDTAVQLLNILRMLENPLQVVIVCKVLLLLCSGLERREEAQLLAQILEGSRECFADSP